MQHSAIYSYHWGHNPLLGIVAGAAVTAIIQSSSASVGILQSLAAAGLVPFGAAIYIIMGQNIGTCVTAILSSVGAKKNAKTAALMHLIFNIIGTIIFSIICDRISEYCESGMGAWKYHPDTDQYGAYGIQYCDNRSAVPGF